jgi:hypothetical protein
MPVVNMERSANAPMVVSHTKKKEFAVGIGWDQPVECVKMATNKKMSVLNKYYVWKDNSASDVIVQDEIYNVDMFLWEEDA